jgi:hypothetical protein
MSGGLESSVPPCSWVIQQEYAGLVGRVVAVVVVGILACCLAACSPVSEPEAQDCAGAELRDDAGICVPIHCGRGPWGDLERASGTIHVAPWGDDSDAGDEASPLSSIQEAFGRAGTAGGGTVALAGGRYDEALMYWWRDAPTQLTGRCQELAVIDASGSGSPGLNIAAGEFAVRQVTFTGGERGVVARNAASAEVDLELTDVSIDRALGIGLFVGDSDTRVVGTRLIVRGTLQRYSDDPLDDPGRGIEIQRGATLVLREVLLEGNLDTGLVVWEPGTRVEIDGGVIRGTRAILPEGSGWGVAVQEQATLVARDLLVEDNEEVGLLGGDPGTLVELEGVTVRGTVASYAGKGKGVTIQYGARLLARDLLIEDNEGVGLFVGGLGSTAEVSDVRILSTRPAGELDLGQGLSAAVGGTITAEDLVARDNHGIGVFAVGGITPLAAATTISVEGGLIEDTTSSTVHGGGIGVAAQGRDARLVLQDVTVRGSTGPGAYVDSGRIACTDCRLEENQFAGVVSISGSVRLDGGTVSRIGADGPRGGGVGLYAWAHPDVGGFPELHLDSTALEDLPGPAIYLRGAGLYDIREATISNVAGVAGPFGSPPGLFAAEGVISAGKTRHLVIAGTRFEDLPGDAILLDASSATVMGCAFDDVEGFDVYAQHCESLAPPTVAGESIDWNGCEGPSQVVDPLLAWVPMLLPSGEVR